MYPFNFFSTAAQESLQDETARWEQYIDSRRAIADALKEVRDAAACYSEIEEQIKNHSNSKVSEAGLAYRKIWKRYGKIKSRAIRRLEALRPKIFMEGVIMDNLQAKINGSLKYHDGIDRVPAIMEQYNQHKKLRDALSEECDTIIRSIKNAKKDTEMKEREISLRCPAFHFIRRDLDDAYKKYEAALDNLSRVARKGARIEKEFYGLHHETFELQALVLRVADVAAMSMHD